MLHGLEIALVGQNNILGCCFYMRSSRLYRKKGIHRIFSFPLHVSGGFETILAKTGETSHSCVYEMYHAYGRHQLSRPMPIVGPIQIWRGCGIYIFFYRLRDKFIYFFPAPLFFFPPLPSQPPSPPPRGFFGIFFSCPVPTWPNWAELVKMYMGYPWVTRKFSKIWKFSNFCFRKTGIEEKTVTGKCISMLLSVYTGEP